jgi:glucan biosynthesis protein C
VILDLFVLNGLDSDRERQVLGFCFFIIGYLIANQPEVWQAVKNLRGYSLVLAFISFGLVITTYQIIYLNDAVEKTDAIELLLSFLYQANRWLGLTCILGFASTYLNKKSKVIEYLNPRVFPFYILHQTVIIWVGYPLI